MLFRSQFQTLYKSLLFNLALQTNINFQYLMQKKRKGSDHPVFEIEKNFEFDPSPEIQAGFFSKVFFLWTNKLMRRGAKKPLEMNDIFDLKPVEQPQYAHDKFTEIYQSLDANYKSKTFTVLRIFLTWTFVAAAVYGIFANLLQFAGPLMINQILIFLEDPSVETKWGYIWSSILVVAFAVRSIALQHAFHLINEASIKMMNSLNTKIYFKILQLSSASRKYLQTGAIMNYINVDVQAVNFAIQMSNFVFSTPVMVVVAIILIIREVGWIGISAPVIMFLGVFFQQKLMKVAFAMRKDQLFWTDKRSKCVTQYFGGIRIIKYYGWEEIVSKKIQNIRAEEIKLIFKALMIRTYIEVIMNMMPIIASILCFGMYVYFYGSEGLSPAKAYTVMSLFNLMANPMRMLVMSLIQVANAKASMTRIQHFFEYFDMKNQGINSDDTSLGVGQIKIINGKFKWQTQQAKDHFEKGKKLMNKTPAEKKKMQQQKNKEKEQKKTKKKQYKQEKSKTFEETGRYSKASLYTQNNIAEPLLKNKENRLNQIQQEEKKQASTQKESQDRNQSKEPKVQLVSQKQNLQQQNESSYEKEQKPELSLQIQNFHVKQTELVAVIGRVGSGKSTLLSAILNEVDKVQGTVSRRGRVAYIPQISWLRSATIRENIVFESQYKEEWYKHVLKICQLENDMEVLGGGDLTEVGQKGVNLSGGQKQRISIARALYADADIYLIDDCLSALDSYVAKKIFTNVITGALRTKTVIFVTHAIHFVKECDTILVMSNGKIHERGSYQDLINQQKSLFRSLQSQYRQQEKAHEQEQQQIEKQKSQRKKSQVAIEGEKPKKQEKMQGLVKVEQRTKGKVPWSVYYRFFTGAGGFLTFLMFFFITIGQFSRVGSDWWVGSWSSNAFHLPQTTYIWIYACISILVGLLILIKGYFFAKFINNSSQTLQRQLIQTLLKSPLSWFDVTPTGRILSRTTKDQDDLDTSLAFNVQMTVQNLLIMFTSIVVAGIATPIYFAFAGVALVVYYFVIKYYMLTSVELKRLQANTRAPLISHIQQTINGVYVIRAFNKNQNFIKKFFKRQKQYIVAFNNQNAANRWISILTDMFAVAIIGGAAFLGVLERGKTSATLIGLSLSWTLQISSVLSFTLKLMADTQSNMNAVIRLLDYIDHNPSQKDFKEPKPPKKKWPKAGKYKMDNLTYRYRPQLQDVIHGISFDVSAKAKIGVVGRTGSGKSTLTLGLLRILELSQDPQGRIGQIKLDGVDVGKIGLHELRHKVTIIPQDPVLFSGTLKDNIDPFNIYSDEDIALCLQKVDMWDQIKPNSQQKTQLMQKVYGVVDDSGSNYSVGQRQLVCMARALIRKPKVLLMDEATASIDQKTDSLLQKMIRKQFKDTTVITIAHRLNTIINYDKILVLDYGKIKEYSTPKQLILNEDSFLGNLVKETGKEYQERMITLLNTPLADQ